MNGIALWPLKLVPQSLARFAPVPLAKALKQGGKQDEPNTAIVGMRAATNERRHELAAVYLLVEF